MRLGFVLLGFLPACAWVSPADLEARRDEVDDDGDGVPAADDCDDGDASISPNAPEVWYDGVDQRCDGLDDYDQDGDGWVPDAYAGLATKGVPGSGALPAGDCDDQEPMVSPQQPDTWYDGLDQDCDGADDYDQDGDGYVETANVGKATAHADGSGALPGGDCDDADAATNPAVVETWYDGVDADCAGDDDWDQDGDGYYADAWADDYGPTTYAPGTGGLPGGDCDDTRADVAPGAADAWYDGLDADCAGDDDYDRDADGWPDARAGGTDCDDTEDAVYPGARETLDDGVDADCDGDADSFALAGVSGYAWTGPRAPVFDESTDRVYLSVVADELDSGATHYYDSGVALLWSNADPSDGIDGLAAWSAYTSARDYDPGPGQGFVATDDYLYGLVDCDYGDSRALKPTRYSLSTGARTEALSTGSAGLGAFADVSFARDADGAVHGVGCEADAGVLHYLRIAASWTGGFDAELEVSDVAASACALDVRDGAGVVYTAEAGGIGAWTFDPTAASPTFTGGLYAAGYRALDLDVPSGWSEPVLVVADATSGDVVLLDATGATALGVAVPPVAVDVAVAADGTLYVAYVSRDGEARLAWGTAEAGFSEVPLGVDFAVEDVSVWVSGSQLLYAATGASDVATGVALR